MFCVQNSNVVDVLPMIKKEIDQSIMISFDIEMSGLDNKIDLFDSLEDRYQTIKKSVENYSMIQLGISLYRQDLTSINKYLSSTYIFYLNSNLNNVMDNVKNNINFNWNSLSFLLNNNFDISTWWELGFNYVNQSNEAALKNNLDYILSKLCSDIEKDIANEYAFILAWLNRLELERFLDLEKNCFKNSVKLQFVVTKNLIYDYYFLNQIRKFIMAEHNFTSYLKNGQKLWCDQINTNFVVYVVSHDPKATELSRSKGLITSYSTEEIFHNIIETDRDIFKQQIFAVTNLFQYISKSNLLMVGHNCLMDLMFVYSSFFRSLPDSLDEFRKEIVTIFPKIYDTKLIAQQERMLNVRYKCLLQCFISLCNNHQFFRNCVPDILVRNFFDIFHIDKDTYTNALFYTRSQMHMPHNAGFDSFITGFIFLFFGFIKMKQSKAPLSHKRSEKKLFLDFREFLTDGISQYCNKVYLAKFFNQPLTLSSSKFTPRDFPKVIIQFPSQKAVELFFQLQEQVKYVDYKQLSPNCYVTASTYFKKHETFLLLLADKLQQHGMLNSTVFYNHKDYEKKLKIRKYSWITFLASSACFVFLLTRLKQC